jgi:hypothetical protein
MSKIGRIQFHWNSNGNVLINHNIKNLNFAVTHHVTSDGSKLPVLGVDPGEQDHMIFALSTFALIDHLSSTLTSGAVIFLWKNLIGGVLTGLDMGTSPFESERLKSVSIDLYRDDKKMLFTKLVVKKKKLFVNEFELESDLSALATNAYIIVKQSAPEDIAQALKLNIFMLIQSYVHVIKNVVNSGQNKAVLRNEFYRIYLALLNAGFIKETVDLTLLDKYIKDYKTQLEDVNEVKEYFRNDRALFF